MMEMSKEKKDYKWEWCYKEKLEHEIEDLSSKPIRSYDDVENMKCLLKTHKNLCKYLRHQHEVPDTLEDHTIFAEIEHILKNPPHTWYAYMGKPDGHMSIIEMELGEMTRAYNDMRSDKPTLGWNDYMKEAHHLAAALVYAIKEGTCSEHKKDDEYDAY